MEYGHFLRPDNMDLSCMKMIEKEEINFKSQPLIIMISVLTHEYDNSLLSKTLPRGAFFKQKDKGVFSGSSNPSPQC